MYGLKPKESREVVVNIVALVMAAATVWIAQAIGLSRLMSKRGFHPLPWFAVSMLLGPAMWPLALIEAITGPPGPELIRRGTRGTGSLDVLVAFPTNELPDDLERQIARLPKERDRLTLARIIKAGGPMDIEKDAARFLSSTASRLRLRDAELMVFQGTPEQVLADLHARGDFDLVLCSDRPGELFDGNGSIQEVRCLRDAAA